MLRIRDREGKGREVVAVRDFKKGELIERAPVIVIPGDQWEHLEKTILDNYCFRFGTGDAAIILGYGSLLNHSYRPNAEYVRRTEELHIEILALCDISEGEEITINYNGVPDDQTAVWFDVIE